MATIVQKTIGTGGDYTSVATWEDASPVNLVTADQVWEGRVLDQLLTITVTNTIGGSTTSTTCYKHLTAQDGASFADNVAHTLNYDETNGATIKSTTTYVNALRITEANVHVSRLQLSCRHRVVYFDTPAGDSTTIDSCILNTSENHVLYSNRGDNSGTATYLVNSLILCSGSSGTEAFTFGKYAVYGCTFCNIGTNTSKPGIDPTYSTCNIYNSVFANIGNLVAQRPAQVICANTYTTGNAFSGCTVVALNTTTGTGFVNASMNLTGDYKLNPTSALVGSAGLYAPYTNDDIYGTPRGATPDVGAYEIGGPPVGVDHATDGDIIGNPADVTGTATLTEPVTVHQATGAVTGLTSTVTGTAKRFLLHTTSGDVVDSNDATVTGQAELINAVYIHETEGVLTGQLGTVTGTARRFRTHPTDGIVIGDPWATVEGIAEIVSPPGEHETYGALSGQHGTVVGTAKHLRKHVTTGALAGRTAVVTGEAVKFAEHDTSGIIVGYDAKVVGSATNVGSLTLTPADISAIVAALQAAILPVDIVRVNHIDVDGTGSPGDEWGPV